MWSSVLRRVDLCIALILGACQGPTPAQAQVADLKVATFNIAQTNGMTLNQVINVMQSVDADIYGLQETDQGQGPTIAAALGYHHAQGAHGPGRSFISRYPILEVSSSAHAARIQVSTNQMVWIANAHIGLHPNWEASYIPYAAVHGLSEQQMIDNVLGLDNWVTHIDEIEAELSPIINAGQGIPIFFTGDFNEPSHLDWTEAQVGAGIIPTAVDAPLSNVMTDGLQVDRVTDLVDQNGNIVQSNVHIDVDYDGFGFRDSYHVDRVQDGQHEVSRRGFTWTPFGGPRDDDRIDFVYYQGDGVSVLDSQVFGESGGLGVDLGFEGFPSDHRGVVSSFSIPATTPCGLFADLNGDCTVDDADWIRFRAGQHTDMTGLSHAEAYSYGDLNNDQANDHADFVLFKAAFDEAQGAGSFAAMVARVPEPSTAILCGIGLAVLVSLTYPSVRVRPGQPPSTESAA